MKQPLLIPVLLDGIAYYQLVEDYEQVPKGLIVDGASVPRWLWSYAPPDGLHRAAALIHDWDYINKGFDGLMTRKDCDQLFRENLLASGLTTGNARTFYYGVRLGGWVPWGKPKVAPDIRPILNRAPVHFEEIRDLFASHLYYEN